MNKTLIVLSLSMFFMAAGFGVAYALDTEPVKTEVATKKEDEGDKKKKKKAKKGKKGACCPGKEGASHCKPGAEGAAPGGCCAGKKKA